MRRLLRGQYYRQHQRPIWKGVVWPKLISDATAPTITVGPVVAVDGLTITFTWTTDELSDSGVEFWTDAEGYAGRHSVQYPADSVLSHSVVVDSTDGIAYNNVYNYQVVSHDAVGNAVTSDVGTFAVTEFDGLLLGQM